MKSGMVVLILNLVAIAFIGFISRSAYESVQHLCIFALFISPTLFKDQSNYKLFKTKDWRYEDLLLEYKKQRNSFKLTIQHKDIEK